MDGWGDGWVDGPKIIQIAIESTHTCIDANHNNERKSGGLGPASNKKTVLDQLVQRQFLPGLPSLRRGILAEPAEAPKTQPNDDEQQTQQPNPNPDKTKPRTNTPHSPQIAEALYAGASFGSAMPMIRRWTFSPCQDRSAYAGGPLLHRFLFSIF